MSPIEARSLLAFHDGRQPAAGDSALWRAVEDNHRNNRLLWDEEDLARRRGVADAEIAKNKRAIDGYNQKRNDAVERADEQLWQLYFEKDFPAGARQSSETPGAMIDRLSILSLKIRSMRLQTERSDVAPAHIEQCRQKLARLEEQRADLAACLDRLLAECARGESRFKIYRQFKMYNDPALNPAIYGEARGKTPAGMMRIGLLVDSLIGGGAERVVLNLAAQFHERGHEVHILTVRREVQFALEEGKYRVHALSEDGGLSPLRPLNKWLLVRRLAAKVRELCADGRAFGFFLSNSEEANRLAVMAGLPRLYLVCHNSELHMLEARVRHRSPWKRALRRWRWMRRLHAFYDGRDVITVSRAIGAELTGPLGLAPRSVATIYNPFDFEEIRRAAQAPATLPAQPYVVCVARFQNRKRQDLLLRAFAQLGDPALRLVLVGGLYTDSDRRWRDALQALAAELGIAGRVDFPGFQRNPYPWIRGARLSVLCSDSEGLGNVLVESLLLGVPAVATDCPHGPGEILTGPLARYLSPPGDAAALARNMRDALQSYATPDDAALERFRTGADQYLAHCGAT